MAANLPELYKNNVGPVGDRQEKQRCSVHSPNATQMRNYKNTHFSHACTTGFHIVFAKVKSFPQIDLQDIAVI